MIYSQFFSFLDKVSFAKVSDIHHPEMSVSSTFSLQHCLYNKQVCFQTLNKSQETSFFFLDTFKFW